MLPERLAIDLGMKDRGTTKPLPGKISMRAAAEKLGVTNPQLRDVIFTGTNAGLEFEEKVAKLWFGGDVTKLRKAADKWAAAQGEEVDSTKVPALEKPERYHAMPAVRAMAKAEGYPPEFMRDFEALLDFDEQPAASMLWTICMAEYARWKGKMVKSKVDPSEGLDRDGPSLRDTLKKR